MCVIDLTDVESIYAHSFEIYSDLFEIKSIDRKLSCRAINVPWWKIILYSKKDSLV
jgi:hypothetical protein